VGGRDGGVCQVLAAGLSADRVSRGVRGLLLGVTLARGLARSQALARRRAVPVKDRYCCRARGHQPRRPPLAKIAREEVVAPCITRASGLRANKSGSCSRHERKSEFCFEVGNET
jgi:hypothetical protein